MNKDTGKYEYKYLTYGVLAGLLFGTFMALMTSQNIGIWAGFGMLLGIVIGTTIDYIEKKKKQEK